MQSQADKTTVSNSNSGNPPRVLGELRRRVLGWMLLLALAPMAVMTIQGYHCAVQAISEKTRDHLLSLLNSRRSVVETWVHQRQSELDVLASSPSVARCCAHFAEMTEAEIDAEVTMMLRDILNRVDAYDDISVFGANGNVIANVSRRHPAGGAAVSHNAQKRAMDAKSESIGPPIRAADGHVTVQVIRPLFKGKTHVGAILATLDLTKGLDPLLQDRAGMGKTGKVYLTTRNGAILTEPFTGMTPVALRQQVGSEYLALAKAKTPEITDLTDYRGHEVLGGARPVAGTDWLLVAEQDRWEADAWLITLLYRAAITGAITIAVLVLVTLWISDRLGRPLRDLAQVARSIRAGEVEARLGPLPGAEAEEVRRTFNEMLDDLREKQRQLVLSATLASVGELSSSVAHEMRNPLSSIKMNLQALRRKVEDDPDYAELAQIAAEQAQRVETMLDDLLQYGRPVELHKQLTGFQELAEAALEVVGDKARSKDVRIEVRDELGGATLAVDREQMCRALTNLLANAIQAVAPGRSVCIAATLRNGSTPGAAQLEVSDTGPGLSTEALERAFKPFFTSKTNGTGLGLANVKKIIELHGGSVAAANRPGGGAVFTITLPMEGVLVGANPGD